jgi:thioredoxin 1
MTKDEFIEKLRVSPRPVVVDFWAPWCQPCLRIKPILQELSEEYAGRVDLWEINTDEEKELMRAMRILGIPTLFIVDQDKEITRIMGVKSPETYRQMFEALATGEELGTPPLATRDRVIRISLAALILLFAWMYGYWWLIPVGLVVAFTGIYDRCPLWNWAAERFKKNLA